MVAGLSEQAKEFQRRPRTPPARVAFLKNGDAYAGERQLERDGSADEPSSGDDGLEFLVIF